MRKFLIFCLLATAAAPLAARPDDDDEIRPARPNRSESRPARADRGDSSGPRSRGTESRPDRPERPQWTGGDRPSRDPIVRPDRPERPDRPNVESPGGEEPRGGSGWSGGRDRPASPLASPDAPDTVRDWRPRDGRGTTRPPRPDTPQVDGDHSGSGAQGWADRRFGDRRPGREPEVSTTPRRWTQPPARVRRDGGSLATHWRREWRDDRRYDWRDHRRRHRSTFHIGIYYDPFGWGYRRYDVGWRLWPNYYSRRHWLTDPWMYRLPPAYPGTQWIRYYDDALLVDTWTGEVIDVIYDFFW